MDEERRRLSRKNFSYYMRVKEEVSGQVIGHFSDISAGGFRIDTTQSLPLNVDFRLYVDQIGEITNRMYVLFKARPVWCKQDQFDPSMYNVGFKLVDIKPVDREIYLKMYDVYGSDQPTFPADNAEDFPPA